VTFGFFGGHAIASSWVGKRAGMGKAHASALYLFFYYVGSSVGNTAGGFFWSMDGWGGVILMIVVFVLGNILLTLLLPAIPLTPHNSKA
jgi:YNFM family putative membrane transporter